MSCGAISSTVVRQRRSKSRIVLLSTSPSRCMPRTPSCTVCAISLRYFRLAIRSHLLELVAGDHRRDADIVEVEDHCSVILQVALVGHADILLSTLGEAVQEYCARPAAVGDDRAKATAPPLSRPGNSLLDETSAEACVDQPTLGASHSRKQRFVIDMLLPLEAPERLRLEDPHNSPPARRHIALSHIDFNCLRGVSLNGSRGSWASMSPRAFPCRCGACRPCRRRGA